MQTEGLSQHVSCQHCQGQEKPIAVVVPGKDQQRRQLTCFCTDCWNFTSIHHSKIAPMNVSFFKQYNHETGKFHRALPYADDKHPRRIRGPIADHELECWSNTKLNMTKTAGPARPRTPVFLLRRGTRKGHHEGLAITAGRRSLSCAAKRAAERTVILRRARACSTTDASLPAPAWDAQRAPRGACDHSRSQEPIVRGQAGGGLYLCKLLADVRGCVARSPRYGGRRHAVCNVSPASLRRRLGRQHLRDASFDAHLHV